MFKLLNQQQGKTFTLDAIKDFHHIFLRYRNVFKVINQSVKAMEN